VLYQLEERRVELRGSEHYVAHNATVIGSVELGERASVWFGAVVRGDDERIVLGEECNVQDGAVLHADPGYPLVLERGVTVGHMAMLHGCHVGEHTVVGIKTVILNGARIGRNCILGANALIPEGKEIPEGSLVVGMPGRVKRALNGEEIAGLRHSAERYAERIRRYHRALRPDERSARVGTP